MKGWRALDPEESAFSKLIASELREDSSEIPRAEQGNATKKRSARPPQSGLTVNRALDLTVSYREM